MVRVGGWVVRVWLSGGTCGYWLKCYARMLFTKSMSVVPVQGGGFVLLHVLALSQLGGL